MTTTLTIQGVKRLLETATQNLKLAKAMMDKLHPDPPSTSIYSDTGSVSPSRTPIEGVFDGESMVDESGNVYQIPANYASKSKLVFGDRLKLTVTDEGHFLFKQIGLVDRKRIIGTVRFQDGCYTVEHVVMANPDGSALRKYYRVLLASITYFHADVGDMVTCIIPANDNGDFGWAAIENVLPQSINRNNHEDNS